MYAIVQTGGKQYKVEENSVLRIEKLDAEIGGTVELDRVLMVSSDDGLKVGAPVVEGAKVIGKVLRQTKGRKVNGFTYKPKKSTHRHYGHRQSLTEVLVEKIQF